MTAEPPSTEAEILAILEARHGDPFAFLGRHRLPDGSWLVRSIQPQARRVSFVSADGAQTWLLTRVHHHGFFQAILPAGAWVDASGRHHQLEIETHEGTVHRQVDPYDFSPLLGEKDVELPGGADDDGGWCAGRTLRRLGTECAPRVSSGRF
jgi:1,4-alpha-glucan branching enzyme